MTRPLPVLLDLHSAMHSAARRGIYTFAYHCWSQSKKGEVDAVVERLLSAISSVEMLTVLTRWAERSGRDGLLATRRPAQSLAACWAACPEPAWLSRPACWPVETGRDEHLPPGLLPATRWPAAACAGRHRVPKRRGWPTRLPPAAAVLLTAAPTTSCAPLPPLNGTCVVARTGDNKDGSGSDYEKH